MGRGQPYGAQPTGDRGREWRQYPTHQIDRTSGERCVGQVPRNWGQPTTLLAAMTHNGISASFVVDGAADQLAFETFVDQLLAPTLRPGQIVIWDNLSVHKSARARQVIEEQVRELRFLPPYSPDFNPIEQAFGKLKAHLRQAGQRTRDGLWDAIGIGITAVTASDARGWFRHCGYVSESQA